MARFPLADRCISLLLCRQEFIDCSKSFQKAHNRVDLRNERKTFEQASNELQKEIDELVEQIEAEKGREAERVKVKSATVEQLKDEREGQLFKVLLPSRF
jgi:seryl-tRNA synthetase